MQNAYNPNSSSWTVSSALIAPNVPLDTLLPNTNTATDHAPHPSKTGKVYIFAQMALQALPLCGLEFRLCSPQRPKTCKHQVCVHVCVCVCMYAFMSVCMCICTTVLSVTSYKPYPIPYSSENLKQLSDGKQEDKTL